MEELNLKTTGSKCCKLLSDLNSEKGLEIDDIIEIEIILEKWKIPKTKINAGKEFIISDKY